MFEKITPEQAGVPSANVAALLRVLKESGCATHDLLLMKGEKVFAEYYWAPFHKDFLHRQYSQTKSFVGVAIGLLIEDGRLALDDRVADYFPERIERELPSNLAALTVRQMLTMCTTGQPPAWFTAADEDRTHLYFNETAGRIKGGLRWEYDSPGSQVLCTLVEKLAGQSLLDFLRERLFNEMGVFGTARLLKCKNNDGWGDSALLCTARDMAAFGLLVMRYGNWQGKQLMSEAYLREATSPLVDNDVFGFGSYLRQGYGYQIWCTRDGFAFNGMGDQVTICIPKKDLVCVINSDNQGHPASRGVWVAALYDRIIDSMADAPLPPAEPFEPGELTLAACQGRSFSPLMAQIDGKTYVCQENKAGIEKFSLHFTDEGGEWHYTNAQGDKVLPFCWNANYFGKFPQDGYSTEHGGLRNTEGYRYNCATSAAWRNDRQMALRCQLIDEYFGNLLVRFGFDGEDAQLTLSKTAEDFLNEYTGAITAKMLPQ